MEKISLEGQWVQWKPLQNLAPKYDVESIVDNPNEFSIHLSAQRNENEHLKITFETIVLSYRNTNESFRIKTINDLDKKYGTDFYGRWTFFKIENSTYVSWIGKQSYEFAQPERLIHFVIVAVDSLVDIIAAYEPKVELIEKE